MSKTFVIAPKYLPMRFPITPSVVLYLLLDKFHVSGIALGVILTIWALVLLSCIWAIVHEQRVHPRVIPVTEEIVAALKRLGGRQL